MKRRRAWLLTTTIGGVLCALRGAWLHIQRQQHARNRQLIDALMQADTATALALVNAGADPNTRFSPPPTPVPNLLPHPLSRAALRPAHESPTTLMLACGGHWNPLVDDEAPLVCVAEDLSLLQAMLTHGADVNARTAGNLTALHFALIMREWTRCSCCCGMAWMSMHRMIMGTRR